MTAVTPEAAGDRSHIARRGFGRPWLVAISILISAGCLYLALRNISLAEMGDSLSEASYGWLVPSVALTLAAGWARSFRWRLLFSNHSTLALSHCYAATSVGLMFNNLLPSRAGEIMRVLALRRLTGRSAFEVGTTIVVERILDVFVLAVLGLAIWPLLPDRVWIDALGWLCVAIVAGGFALVAAFGLFSRHARLLLQAALRRVPRLSPARAADVDRAIAAGAAIMRRPGRLVPALLATAAAWGVAGLAGLALFPAFGLDASSLAPWLLLVANSFALVVPSSPGTVGVYEASVQAALVAFGISASAALSYALLLHAVNFFPVIAIGAIASWYTGRHELHPRLRAAAE